MIVLIAVFEIAWAAAVAVTMVGCTLVSVVASPFLRRNDEEGGRLPARR